jgi:hypothetical protein
VKLLLGLLLISSVTAVQSANAQRATFLLPETGKLISLKFEPTPHNPASSRSIDISSEERHVRFVPKAPVAHIPESSEERLQRGLWDKVSGLKLHSSRYFFQGEYGIDSKVHTLLFFVGEPGIGAAPLFVVGFSADSTPFKVLERGEFDVYGFQPIDDKDVLIIGKATMSQVISGDGSNGSKTTYATTYDPFSVYIAHGLSPAQYSLTESAKYNKAHYVWAGPHSREDYVVLYNVQGIQVSWVRQLPIWRHS